MFWLKHKPVLGDVSSVSLASADSFSSVFRPECNSRKFSAG